MIEVRNVDGRLHVARKERHPDEWDPPIEPYDPYGPGEKVSADVSMNSPTTETVSADAGGVSDYAGQRSARQDQNRDAQARRRARRRLGLVTRRLGAGVSIENGRRTSKQSKEHLWMGRRDLPRLNAGSVSYHLRASGPLSTGNG